MAKVADVKLTDNSAEILQAAKEQIALGLEAIGGQMELHAKEKCQVDTGRLRNSITFATSGTQGSANTSGGAEAKPEDYAQHGRAEENEVVVGTNVEYAPEQEYYGKKAHFLKNAAAGHSDEYKKILEAALKA